MTGKRKKVAGQASLPSSVQRHPGFGGRRSFWNGVVFLVRGKERATGMEIGECGRRFENFQLPGGGHEQASRERHC